MAKPYSIADDPDTLKPVVEALIFASEEPLSPRMLAKLIAGEKEESPESDEGSGETDNADANVLDVSDTAGATERVLTQTMNGTPAGWQEREIGVEPENAEEGEPSVAGDAEDIAE